MSTEELQAIFSTEEMSDPQAQSLLLEFLRGQECDVVQKKSGECSQDDR